MLQAARQEEQRKGRKRARADLPLLLPFPFSQISTDTPTSTSPLPPNSPLYKLRTTRKKKTSLLNSISLTSTPTSSRKVSSHFLPPFLSPSHVELTPSCCFAISVSSSKNAPKRKKLGVDDVVGADDGDEEEVSLSFLSLSHPSHRRNMS